MQPSGAESDNSTPVLELKEQTLYLCRGSKIARYTCVEAERDISLPVQVVKGISVYLCRG